MTPSPGNFDGLRVAAFESRMADEMARLIEKHAGQPFVSPSMREIPLGENAATIDFANRVLTGEIDMVIFTTGVGFRYLLGIVEKHVDRQRFLDSLSDITTIARGPKPVAALRDAGITPTHRVPPPNTWRELLATIDAHVKVSNQPVALQEYGKTNSSLIAGLESRGARVIRVPIYRWGLPEDLKPLHANIRAIVGGQRDAVMFTSAHQVTNVLSQAHELGLQDDFQAAMHRIFVCSIGPSTSEALNANDLTVDFESPQGKLGHLISEAAARSRDSIHRKTRIHAAMSGPASHSSDANAPWYDSPFMRACRREPNDVTPIWLMRQAGRYMSEYREIRDKTTFLELCKNPALCAEIMVTTVKRLGVDAAIIFSDLLPILEPMGLELEYAKGEGPIIHNPVRAPLDVDRVDALESVESLDFVMETVRQTRNSLPADIPLIGFAGAPFTLASYVIEGGASRSFLHTKTLMFRDQGAWHELMKRFVRSVTMYLNAQIAAGAQCVQLFDSWVGCLGPQDYQRFVLPHVRQLIAGLTRGVPVINFATGNPALLPDLAQGGAPVVGVDWRVRLDEAWKTVGYELSVQGNLDPLALMAEPSELRRRAHDVLRQAAGRPGHIFNLGHGILPQTDVDQVIRLVDIVHEGD